MHAVNIPVSTALGYENDLHTCERVLAAMTLQGTCILQYLCSQHVHVHLYQSEGTRVYSKGLL